jgi:hypothetical protein
MTPQRIRDLLASVAAPECVSVTVDAAEFRELLALADQDPASDSRLLYRATSAEAAVVLAREALAQAEDRIAELEAEVVRLRGDSKKACAAIVYLAGKLSTPSKLSPAWVLEALELATSALAEKEE